jgi:hypothetical protein
MIVGMANTKGGTVRRESITPGEQADRELKKMLAETDPLIEDSLKVLRVSEEHYFAAVQHEGNRQPTTFSSSAEL